MQSSTAIQLELRDIATNVIERAMKLGATAAECVARDGSEFSTVVRLGEVETLKESGSKALGVRVFFGNRTAKRARESIAIARHHRDEIDLVFEGDARDLRGRIAVDKQRLSLNAHEQRIG